MVKLSNNGPGIVGYGWELGRRNVAATAGQTPFGSRAAGSPLVPQQVCGKATVGALGGGGKKMGAGKKIFIGWHMVIVVKMYMAIEGYSVACFG